MGLTSRTSLTIDPAANATGDSTAFALGKQTSTEMVPVAVMCPSNLQSTTHFKLQVAYPTAGADPVNADFKDIYVNGALVPHAMTASALVLISTPVAAACLGAPYIRLVTCDSSGTAADPGATIILVLHYSRAEALPGNANGGSGAIGAVTVTSGSITAVPPPTVRVRATLNSASPGTIAAAGDYTAGDVINQSTSAGVSWVIPSAARSSGRGGHIKKVLMTCSVAAMVPRTRIHLFNSAPTVLQNDNVALVLDLDDRAAYLGYIDMPALQTSGSSEFSFALNDALEHAFQTSGSANLNFVLQAIDAFTNESASMTIDIYFTIAQD